MPFTKHVGQIVSTQQKVVVMFRQIPEDPEFCLESKGGLFWIFNIMGRLLSSVSRNFPGPGCRRNANRCRDTLEDGLLWERRLPVRTNEDVRSATADATELSIVFQRPGCPWVV